MADHPVDGGVPPPSPEHFIDTLMGYQRTAALKAAVELGVFTAIAGGAREPAAIAAAIGASERGTAILCNYLVVLGFLEKSAGRYAATPSTQLFLDAKSPAYFGGIVEFLASREMMALLLDDPAAFVRHGGSIGLANTAPDNPIWVKFAQAMVPLMVPSIQAIAARAATATHPIRKVLDISAGHGAYGIAVAQAVPGAEIVGLDWANVLALAKRNAEAAGVGDRYRTLPGSAFELTWGGGYDLILIPSFLHHFDPEASTALLAKARAALAPGGHVVVSEFIIEPGGISPPWPAAFSFLMLATTQTGRAYTAEELTGMAKAAGFASVSVEPVHPSPHSLVWMH